MKRLLGDDEESGGLKLGGHAFSDTMGVDVTSGSYSRAIQTLRSFGSILAPPPTASGSSRGAAGGSMRPRAPQQRR